MVLGLVSDRPFFKNFKSTRFHLLKYINQQYKNIGFIRYLINKPLKKDAIYSIFNDKNSQELIELILFDVIFKYFNSFKYEL